MAATNEFIRDAGGCIVSKRILDGEYPLRWCYRDQSTNPVDNGWRFISAVDDEEYINNPDNNVVVDFNTVAAIEPAVIAIYDMPVGTDLELVHNADGSMQFIDNETGKPIDM
jgi:hypothetical protein